MKSLFDRAWHSSTLMTWLSFAAKSGGLLLVTPLVLRFLTPAEASLWFLFLTINAITQMADFGFGPSFVRAISYARAGRTSLHDSDSPLLDAPNQSLLSAIYVTLRKSYQRLTFIGGSIALVLGSLSLVRPISQLSNQQEGWLAWAIVWMASVIVFRNSAYAQWLQGMNMVAFVRRIEAACAVVATAVTAVVLWVTHDFLLAVTAASLGASIASLVVRRFACRNQHSRTRVILSEATESVTRFVWPAAWRSGIGMVMSHLAIQSSGIIYAQIAPAAEAASYLLALRVMQAILQVSMAPFYSKLPVFASLYARGDKMLVVRNAQLAMSQSHWVFVLLVFLAVLGIPPILLAISSKVVFVSSALWLYLAIAFFAERFGAMHMQLYSLTNHILWHVANGITGSIFIVTSVALLPLLGITAFPTGMLCGYLGYYSWYGARLSYTHYQQSCYNFEKRSALLPFVALLTLLTAQLFI